MHITGGKIFKKFRLVSSFKYITAVDCIDISSPVWKNNKFVMMLPTLLEHNPVKKINRFDWNQKIIEVNFPCVIQEYNRHMGGVEHFG